MVMMSCSSSGGGGRSPRRKTIVTGTCACIFLAASCAREAPPSQAPMPAAAWQKIEDGWARTVPLAAPLVLDGARAGDVFEAVIVPAAPGELLVESKAGIERVRVEGTTRVAVPV